MDMAKLTREEVIEKVAAGKSLERANLYNANLRGARYDKDTKFPEGFDPE